jgi:hypothetical protein
LRRERAGDQTMTPGRTLAATRTTDEMAARAVAMTFIVVVSC